MFNRLFLLLCIGLLVVIGILFKVTSFCPWSISRSSDKGLNAIDDCTCLPIEGSARGTVLIALM